MKKVVLTHFRSKPCRGFSRLSKLNSGWDEKHRMYFYRGKQNKSCYFFSLLSDSNWLTDWRKNRITRFPNRAYVDVSFSFYSRWPKEKNIYIKKEYSSWSAWSTYKYRRSQPGTVATKKKKKQQKIEKTVWREKRKAARNNLQDFYVFFQLVPLSH